MAAPQTTIVTPDSVTATEQFSGTENGSISTPDSSSAAVMQPASGGTPIVVSLIQYTSATNPAATYDLQVLASNAKLGISSGLEVVGTFAIPPSDAFPRLGYQIKPTDPVSYVPDSMFVIVGKNFVVTFTDHTPVTVADLSGTVFTITDFADLSLALVTLSAPQNNDVANDVLGDLLSSHDSAGGGQMIGAVAPTTVSIPPVSTDPNGDVPEQTRTWIRLMENLFREVQQIFGPQLYLSLESMLLSTQVSISAPQATPAAESPETFAVLVPESVVSLSEPQDAVGQESAAPAAAAEPAVLDGDAVVAADQVFYSSQVTAGWSANSDRRLWPYLAVAAALSCSEWLRSREKRQSGMAPAEKEPTPRKA